MKLSPEQEDAIYQLVASQNLKIESLRNDIVDHLCCVVESQLNKKNSFDKVLEQAIKELAPNGLLELEQQTLFLLNTKRILIMKKLKYSIGFIGALTLTFGITFKLLHMPWGNKLFTIGFLTLLLVFIPLVALDRYKVAISNALSERLKIVLGASAALITGLAGLFKILHLQGANVLLVVGAFVFAFGFLPFLFFTMYKKSVA